MNLLVTGYLHPLKDLDTEHGISRVSDDFNAKMEYVDTINELNDLHDEVEVTTASTEGLARLALVSNNEFKKIALESLQTAVDLAVLKERVAELEQKTGKHK